MTDMLLSSHIKGFVENPGYYFEKDDAERRRHLDLLLMVQGWRRFGIRQPEIVEPYEKSQMIVGEVNKFVQSKSPKTTHILENCARCASPF